MAKEGLTARISKFTAVHPDVYPLPLNPSSPERCLLAALLERSVRDLNLRSADHTAICVDAIVWFEGKRKDEPIPFSTVVEQLELSTRVLNRIKYLIKVANTYVYQCEQQRKEGRERYSTLAKREWDALCKKNGTILW